jgi:hypothetical protein
MTASGVVVVYEYEEDTVELSVYAEDNHGAAVPGVDYETAATRLYRKYTVRRGGSLTVYVPQVPGYAELGGETSFTLHSILETDEVRLIYVSEDETLLQVECVEAGTNRSLFDFELPAAPNSTLTVSAPKIHGYKLENPAHQTRSVTVTPGQNRVEFRYTADAPPTQYPTYPPTSYPSPSPSPTPSLSPSPTPTPTPSPSPAPGAPTLAVGEQIAYVQGYPDGTFRPEASVTRAEVAAILFRVVKDSAKNSGAPAKFGDVKAGEWYAQAVNYLAARGVISGYTDGTFKPNQPISREEFTTLAAKFTALISGGSLPFSDVKPGDWSYNYIRTAYAKNWVAGYPDGTFRPRNPITRAETVAVVNRILERTPKGVTPSAPNPFSDLSPAHWAYADVLEATRGPAA